jgi:putative transposase
LSEPERAAVLETLNSERFVDQAPAEVHAELLDQGRYQCSVRTMYRILQASTGVRDRRDQLHHPHYSKPELHAAAPNQVWSWDITKLLGPKKWVHFHLYVIIDIYSRYVPGWLLAPRECAALARGWSSKLARKSA